MTFKNERRWLNFHLAIDYVNTARAKTQHAWSTIIGQTYEADCTDAEANTTQEILDELNAISERLKDVEKKLVKIDTSYH